MHGTDFLGYLGSALVLAAFYAKDMMVLRIAAIGSNLAFIAYGWIDNLTPILILHAILLPLNVVRIVQLRRRPSYSVPQMPEDVRLSWPPATD